MSDFNGPEWDDPYHKIKVLEAKVKTLESDLRSADEEIERLYVEIRESEAVV
jgi:hypothetical protein